MVLVHGLSASSRWWRCTLPALIPHHRAYLVDLPGFGLMRRPLARYELAHASAWLLDWMDAVEIQRVHLVGHSMGGYVSLRLAAEHPERLSRLVLVAPAGVPTRRSMVRYARPLAATAWMARPRFFPLVVPDALPLGRGHCGRLHDNSYVRMLDRCFTTSTRPHYSCGETTMPLCPLRTASSSSDRCRTRGSS